MPTCATPSIQLLSNGSYSVMLDANGSGYSRWRDLAITRWREDPVGDGWGSYLLLRDEDSGDTWSASRQPYGNRTPDDVIAFDTGRASFSRRHHSVHSVLDVAVAAEADIELRRLTLSNHGDRTRTLSLTSYAELVLAPPRADAAEVAVCSHLGRPKEHDPAFAIAPVAAMTIAGLSG